MNKGLCKVSYRDENFPTVLEELLTFSVWETIEKGFEMHRRRIFEVQLTQGKRMSLSQGWGFTIISLCGYSQICNVQSGFAFLTKLCIYNTSLKVKTNTILCHRLLHCTDLTCCPLDMCFYQNFCTLPFYMDIAFLCLMEL